MEQLDVPLCAICYAWHVDERALWVANSVFQAIGGRFVAEFLNKKYDDYADLESKFRAFIDECGYGAEVELREGELYNFPVISEE